MDWESCFNGYGDYQRLKNEVAKILEKVTGKTHSLQEVAVHEALSNSWVDQVPTLVARWGFYFICKAGTA